MEITNGHVSPNKSNNIKKAKESSNMNEVTKKGKTGTSDNIIRQSNQHLTETAAKAKKLLAKEEAVLAGLENIEVVLLSHHHDKGSNESYIDEIIDKTRFNNEKVLDKYRKTITDAITRHDISLIRALKKKSMKNLGEYSQAIERTKIIQQNMRSLKSVSETEHPDQLIRKTIASIKKEGVPDFFLPPRQRIEDLLKD
ncbi:MAG: hypothetical protein JW881_14325 [Spirochaetales bacterium]|nr:hypothetical protein [Spirochaetales bacterium]